MEMFSQGDVSHYLVFLSVMYVNLKLLVPFIRGGGVTLDHLNLFLHAFKRVFYLRLVLKSTILCISKCNK